MAGLALDLMLSYQILLKIRESHGPCSEKISLLLKSREDEALSGGLNDANVTTTTITHHASPPQTSIQQPRANLSDTARY